MSTPGKTIRGHCIECVGSIYDVRDCAGDRLLSGGTCPFFPFRLGRGRPSVKVIRKFCLDCMNGSAPLVRECENAECSLHPYRFGKNPARTGKGYFAKNPRVNGASANEVRAEAVNE